MVGILDAPSEDLDDRRSQHSVSTVRRGRAPRLPQPRKAPLCRAGASAAPPPAALPPSPAPARPSAPARPQPPRQVATTTSLASRIAALTCDFGDKLLEADESQLGKDEGGGGGGGGGGDAAGGAGGTGGGAAANGGGHAPDDAAASLEEIVRLLAGREPPLQVCSRLFVGRAHPPIALKR
jgi:hypothetical protein